MELSNGQTYFYIFCQWFVIAFIAKLAYNVIRMYLVNKAPCRGLKSLEEELNLVRKMALITYKKVMKEHK